MEKAPVVHQPPRGGRVTEHTDIAVTAVFDRRNARLGRVIGVAVAKPLRVGLLEDGARVRIVGRVPVVPLAVDACGDVVAEDVVREASLAHMPHEPPERLGGVRAPLVRGVAWVPGSTHLGPVPGLGVTVPDDVVRVGVQPLGGGGHVHPRQDESLGVGLKGPQKGVIHLCVVVLADPHPAALEDDRLEVDASLRSGRDVDRVVRDAHVHEPEDGLPIHEKARGAVVRTNGHERVVYVAGGNVQCPDLHGSILVSAPARAEGDLVDAPRLEVAHRERAFDLHRLAGCPLARGHGRRHRRRQGRSALTCQLKRQHPVEGLSVPRLHRSPRGHGAPRESDFARHEFEVHGRAGEPNRQWPPRRDRRRADE